jgi:hypothetical protein
LFSLDRERRPLIFGAGLRVGSYRSAGGRNRKKLMKLIHMTHCAAIILAALSASSLHADVTVDASEEQTAKALLKYLAKPNGAYEYDNGGLDWNTHTLSFWSFGLREGMGPAIVTHLFYRFKPLANGKTLVHGDERSWYFDDKDKLHELWNPHWGPATPAEAQVEADDEVRRAFGLPISQ